MIRLGTGNGCQIRHVAPVFALHPGNMSVSTRLRGDWLLSLVRTRKRAGTRPSASGMSFRDGATAPHTEQCIQGRLIRANRRAGASGETGVASITSRKTATGSRTGGSVHCLADAYRWRSRDSRMECRHSCRFAGLRGSYVGGGIIFLYFLCERRYSPGIPARGFPRGRPHVDDGRKVSHCDG